MENLKSFIISCLSLFPLISFAQISDDFSDGDFTYSPEWVGEDSLFAVNEAVLQLNAAEAGDACLALPYSSFLPEVEWRFAIRLSFAPSQNNYAKVYLLSDTVNLRSPYLKGFFLQFGEIGSEDMIELFYQEDGIAYSVFRSTTSIANAFAYNIKVTKSPENLWTLYVDSQQNGIYTPEASAYANSDSTFSASCAFGIYCRYTASNKNRFYFDDFYCGSPLVDTEKPFIQSVIGNTNNHRQVIVTFSENVTPASALDSNHYWVDEIACKPINCEWVENDYKRVKLTFATPFEERRTYALRVNGIMDFSDNEIVEEEQLFLFFQIRRNEVLISEIMADPSPPVLLPESEYVELHNTLQTTVVLQDYQLKIGTSVKTLPPIELPPDGFALIVPKSCESLFANYENLYFVQNLNITDDGQTITLINGEGRILHSVAFKKSWHTNSLKREGGWALEMKDYRNPCAGADNWDSSLSAKGGTPGKHNSQIADNEDYEPPNLLNAVALDSVHVKLFFDETVLPDTLLLPTAFVIDRGISILAVEECPPENRAFILTVAPTMQPHTIYTLSIHTPLCDCAGNASREESFVLFGLAESPEPFDVVINEILSNPFEDTDGDFVELYNRSDKIINLADLYIGTGWGEQPEHVVSVVADGRLLFPGQYVAVAKNRKLTLSQYMTPAPESIVENGALPAFPNDEGAVHLTDLAFRRIDKLVYTKEMHYSLLSSLDGVSLERVHFDYPTEDDNNWKSATESAGWATPATRNSQFASIPELSQQVQIVPEIFSPDGDGNDDFAEIYYHFPESENRITITIFDRYGHYIKQLANNAICGLTGRFRWDGVTDDGRNVLNDMYIVKVQIWNSSGKKQTIRKMIAVVRRI